VFAPGAIVIAGAIEFGYLKTTTPDPPVPVFEGGAVSPFPPPPPPLLTSPLLEEGAGVGPFPGTPAPPVPQGEPPPAAPGL
jgi:hypothetical protein